MRLIHLQRSTGNANTVQDIRYHNGPAKTQAANQDNADYNYNYITPNKVEQGHMTPPRSTTESTDEIYTDSKGNYYIKLMADPTTEPNHYQAIKDETIRLYESIQQPQYEALRNESSSDKVDHESEQQPQYLDVVGDETNEEIYSDISDTIDQVKQLQAQDEDDDGQ